MELLDEAEVRALGALLEKEITTPEYYPLSLNALVNACNQKSNREPVVSYDEETVLQAIERLREKGLALVSTGRESRVPKYLQRFSEKFNFDRRELAVLCVLLLRGPQTPGELRGRTQRLHEFDDLDAVEATLTRLMEREPDALVKRLARQPGTKESSYAQLFGGDVADVYAGCGAGSCGGAPWRRRSGGAAGGRGARSAGGGSRDPRAICRVQEAVRVGR